ncbi:MAG TPA: winged helix-turn-helix transcriptional regulator [Solirubrobacteraceae bacterium]|jgi:DNA-binding HxlR family transcriptional regulator|nr:winged helix-turn-helix transcriptional regulator [Solirubrobacteraceae bacterium]
MPSKRYAQYCPVARSLDVLGERWTLLVVRSLLMGPQRYTDLRDALPGIATDLLTARLRTLEDAGYVQRRELPRPAPATVYELTDSGWRLAHLVLALAQIGLDRLGAPAADEDISPAALVLSLRASLHHDRAAHAEDDYQLELDGESFTVTIENGQLQTTRGPAPNPRCTISTSARTLAQMLSGAADPKAAMAAGDLRLDGPQSCLTRFVSTFAYPTAA